MLRTGLENPFAGSPIFYVQQTTSTMDEARTLIEQGGDITLHSPVRSGTVVMAGFQKSGRGRTVGRVWHAQPNENLLFTLILRKDDVPESGLPLSLLCGLSVAEAIEELLHAYSPGAIVEVKWPNDVLVDRKKISGILTEGKGGYYMVGIGVNCNQRIFPGEISAKAISLALLKGSSIDSSTLLVPILKNILKNLESSSAAERLESRLFAKGNRVTVRNGASDAYEEFAATVKGLAASGALLVVREDTGRLTEIVAGEIF